MKIAALAFGLMATRAYAQTDSVLVKTSDTSTPVNRMVTTTSTGVGALATVRVEQSRFQLSTNAVLNIGTYDAATDVAGDVRLGGTDLLYYDGSTWRTLATNSSSTSGYVLLGPASAQAWTTANVGIFLDETGAGAPNLLQLRSGGTDRFVVGNTGTVTSGTWNGAAIGPTYGGTGQTTVSTGDLLYGSAANTWSKLAGPGAAGQFLRSSAANTFGWSTIQAGDIPAGAGSKWTDGGNYLYPSGGVSTNVQVADVQSHSYGFYSNMNTGAANGYGGYFANTSAGVTSYGVAGYGYPGAGTGYGGYLYSTSSSGSSYGVYASANFTGAGNPAYNYAGFFDSQTTSRDAYGIYVNVNNTATGGAGFTRGAYVVSSQAANAQAYGIYNSVSHTNTSYAGSNYAGYNAISQSGTSATVYGTYASATGGATAYGLYATASGASAANWAGWFNGNAAASIWYDANNTAYYLDANAAGAAINANTNGLILNGQLQNLSTWGMNARAQGILIIPEGSVSDNGAGSITFGSTVIVMNPASGSWIRVAAGTYALGVWGYLYIDMPPIGTRGTTVAPTAAAWVDTDVAYAGRDRVILAQRMGAGNIYTRFTVPAGAATMSDLDGRYVNVPGDTMTGALNVTGTAGGLRLGAANWADAGATYGHVISDDSAYRALMIVGNNIVGNSGYGREVKVWDLLNVQGRCFATTDVRAPIYYDLNDTTYYVDPNSSASAVFAGTIECRDGWTQGGMRFGDVLIQTWNVQWWLWTTYGAIYTDGTTGRFWLYDSSGFGLYYHAWVNGVETNSSIGAFGWVNFDCGAGGSLRLRFGWLNTANEYAEIDAVAQTANAYYSTFYRISY